VLATTTLKPYFETHHAIGTIWLIVVIITAAIEVTGIFRFRRGATRRDRGSQIVLRLTTGPGAVLMVLAPRILPGAEIHPALASVIVGLVIFSSGEALRVWAKVNLGRYFTYAVKTSSDQPVITAGPYRFVRHPSYTGIMLIAIGTGLTFGNWFGLATVTIGALAGLRYRIAVEEKALLADLGGRYQEFAARRKRLIPFIW
jgi:protein-S-isoprenylcysteine O-methyltransferase Ste14